MCNIIVLKPGQMPVESDLFNMCYNNWHSFGLVSIINGRLNVVKEVPTSGEVDPVHIQKLLEQDKGYMRFLHVRHNTVGATSLENTHPFDIYYSDKRQVVFMHNGTLHEYKPKDTGYKYSPDTKNWDANDNNGASDTKIFAETVLQKLAPVCSGDFTSEAMDMVLKKFWPTYSNRGLIIANDLEPVYLGDWKTRKDTDGQEYKTANDDYFSNVVRGPQKERLEREAAEKKAAEDAAKRTQGTEETPSLNTGGSSFRCGKDGKKILQLPADFPVEWPEYESVYHMTARVSSILDGVDFSTRTNSVCVGALTGDEIRGLYQHQDVCIAVMRHVFTDYASLYDDYVDLQDKHDRATDLIAKQKNEIVALTEGRTLN